MYYYLLVTIFIVIPLVGMDGSDDETNTEGESKKEVRINIPSSPTVPPLKRIGTMEQLKMVHTTLGNSDKKISPKLDDNLPVVTPTVAAAVAHTLVYKQDPCDKTNTQKHLKKAFKKMEHDDPNTYQKVNQHILAVSQKLEGNVSAQGIHDYRARKHSNPHSSSRSPDTPQGASSSESPKSKAVNTLLKQQSTLRKEVEKQEQDFEAIKKEAKEMKELFAQLNLQAAEDAALTEQRKANRIAIGGAASTVLIGILSGVLTYYTSNCASHSSNCPNSTGH